MPDVRTPLDDEPWPQAALYDHLDLVAPSGVSGPPAATVGAGELALVLNGLNWSVGLGRALVSGQRYRRTESPSTGASPANTNATLARRDRLVLRRDLAAKVTTVVRLQGEPAVNPLNPPLTQVRSGVFDLPLFSWLVPAASGTALTDVLDERAFLPADGSGMPVYVSTRARDAAIPVPQPGQRCTIAAGQVVSGLTLPTRDMAYRDGAWRQTAPGVIGVWSAPWPEANGDFGVQANNATLLTTYEVGDVGVPFRAALTFGIEGGSTATGTRWDFTAGEVLAGAAATALSAPYVSHLFTGEETVRTKLTTSAPGAVLTGNRLWRIIANRIYGTANGRISGGRVFHITYLAA